jgi:hypothetical protein
MLDLKIFFLNLIDACMVLDMVNLFYYATLDLIYFDYYLIFHVTLIHLILHEICDSYV